MIGLESQTLKSGNEYRTGFPRGLIVRVWPSCEVSTRLGIDENIGSKNRKRTQNSDAATTTTAAAISNDSDTVLSSITQRDEAQENILLQNRKRIKKGIVDPLSLAVSEATSTDEALLHSWADTPQEPTTPLHFPP